MLCAGCTVCPARLAADQGIIIDPASAQCVVRMIATPPITPRSGADRLASSDVDAAGPTDDNQAEVQAEDVPQEELVDVAHEGADVAHLVASPLVGAHGAIIIIRTRAGLVGASRGVDAILAFSPFALQLLTLRRR